MSKVTYIIKASNDSVSENAAKVFVVIAKQNFITSAEVREALKDDLNSSSVNSNIGVLIKKGFVEKSGDGLVITGEGTDLLQEAARIYAEENKPELVKERKTRTKRGTTQDMTDFANEVETLLKDAEFEVKGIVENRSNLEVRLEKRTKGVRQIEVRRDGKVRIFAYGMSEELVKSFEDAGFAIKVGGKNIYIDTKETATKADVETMIKVLG